MNLKILSQNSMQLSEFLQYLAEGLKNTDKVPSLEELSKNLHISVSSLREQMEVARSLGLIEVKPRVGIRRQPYSFKSTIQQSLAYAVALDKNNFQLFAELRRQVEDAFWWKAVVKLEESDKDALEQLVELANEKLTRNPIQIPHVEHREFHLTIFRRLENPFVSGILEAYWAMYEAVGLDVYTDLVYLQRVWGYHAKIARYLREANYEAAHQALIEHMELINLRNEEIKQPFFE